MVVMQTRLTFVQVAGLHVLDVVELGEEAVLLRRAERLKLLQSLAAEVAAVHQEQNAAGASMLDQAVAEVAGGVGLSTATGHLDEGAWPALGKRPLQIADGVDLRGAQTFGLKVRHVPQASA